MELKNDFIKLLKCSVLGDDTDGLSISSDPDRLYRLANRHEVANTIGALVSKRGLFAGTEAGEKFKKAYTMGMFRYTQLTHELRVVGKLLSDAKIPFMPLKGSVIRGYYPDPTLRLSCDIDIYVKNSDLDRAVDVLTASGEYQKEDSVEIYDVSLHSKRGVHLELHFALSENDEKIEKCLSPMFDEYTEVNGDPYHRRMSNEMLVAHHIAHIQKHFLSGGCGVRPFLDLYVLKNNPGYDEKKVIDILSKAGLEKFALSSIALSEIWFGNREHTPITSEMEAYIMKGGAYGSLENKVAINTGKRGGRASYILSRIFPSFSRMKIYYPILGKVPLLYPFLHIVRWVRLIFKKDKSRMSAELKYSGAVSDEGAKRLRKLCEDLSII